MKYGIFTCPVLNEIVNRTSYQKNRRSGEIADYGSWLILVRAVLHWTVTVHYLLSVDLRTWPSVNILRWYLLQKLVHKRVCYTGNLK